MTVLRRALDDRRLGGSGNRVVRNTRRDPQGVEPSGVRFGIAFPSPSNDHTVNERKETAIPPPFLRLGPGALRYARSLIGIILLPLFDEPVYAARLTFGQLRQEHLKSGSSGITM
jgi:hypothetical protein